MSLVEHLPIGRNRGVPVGGEHAEIVVLEDDPQVASVAVEMCREFGLEAASFPAPAPFLAAYGVRPPRVVVLDWLLEREIGSAVFMAVRHRFGDVPIVCWTGMESRLLPAMVAEDGRTRIVDKAAGIGAFGEAIRWALEDPAAPAIAPQLGSNQP